MATFVIDKLKVGDVCTYKGRDYSTQFRLLAKPNSKYPNSVRIRDISDSGVEDLEYGGLNYPVNDFNRNFRKTPDATDRISQEFIVGMLQLKTFGFLNEAQTLLIEADI